MNIKIEIMTREHIDDLVKIEKASFSKPWTYEGFEEEFENDTATFLVATEDNKAVGYIGFYTVIDEGYMANIAVLPEYRKKGIASMLISKAIEICNEYNLVFFSLEVRRSNENAINVYKKFGFETVGERKNFYSAPTEDAYIMTLYFGGRD